MSARRSRTGPLRSALCGLLAGLAGVVAGCSQAIPAGQHVHAPTVPVAPTPRAPSLARFVSVHGNDGASGTADHPWRTLSQSLPKLYAGQVLYVHGGVYREDLNQLNLHRGRDTRPIAVTNVPGERPVVEGAVRLHRPDDWTINGLNVTWSRHLRNPPRFMVSIIGGKGWSWSNSEFWGSRGTANVYVAGYGNSEPGGWSLTGDCFHDGGAPGGDPATNLMLGDMGRPGLGRISRNVFFNDAGKDNLTIGSARATPRHVDVSYNTIYGGRFAVTVRGGVHDIQVTRNVLGGASSDVLVRYDMKRSPGTALSQNLAITRATGQPGAGPLLRPKAAARIGGAGNVLSDADPHFTDVHSCRGFETRVPFLAPYGRYGL